MPADEWDAISLNYTSGTTGNPKGVVYHHRGAALMCYANALAGNMGRHPVYLWTLPMFHCNGWCFPWSISAVAGTHVCLRWVRAKPIYDAIAEHGVTHLCGAPIVMATLVNAAEGGQARLPAESHLHDRRGAAAGSRARGDGRSGLCRRPCLRADRDLRPGGGQRVEGRVGRARRGGERAAKMARQGVRYPALEALAVLDPETMQPVPADGETLGEVFFRGNIVMKGYLKNPDATEAALKDGWFRSGDLGVLHPDGYVQLKDRSKDIIISGGENISSIEVEEALYKHPAVAVVAVVAKPDEKWGETPCAFVELKPGASATAEELIAHARNHLARYKVPAPHRLRGDPEDLDGKDPEIQAEGDGEGGLRKLGVPPLRRALIRPLRENALRRHTLHQVRPCHGVDGLRGGQREIARSVAAVARRQEREQGGV